MQRKLTITIADEVYQGLHQTVGRGSISRFIEDLVRPHVVADHRLDAEYAAIAAEPELEAEAWEWIESAPGEALA